MRTATPPLRYALCVLIMPNGDRVVLVPLILGLVLLVVAKFDLWLFGEGYVGVRTLLTWELAIVVLGLVSAIMVALLSVVFLLRKRWVLAFGAMMSASSFFVSFLIGGEIGAAYLNAT